MKTIEERVQDLKDFLRSLEQESSNPATNIEIEYYDAQGFRISEISYTWRSSRAVYGSSVMRCEYSCASAILAAEDFVIWDGEDNQLFEEAKENLAWLINGVKR